MAARDLRRHGWTWAVGFLLLGLTGCPFESSTPAPSLTNNPNIHFTGRVVGVSDGDTIKILRDRTEVRVRLEGVDCPESSQPHGKRAKQFTSDFCFGKIVGVQEKEKDRYGRTVGEVFLPDGSSLNRELVRNGYAWWYKAYSKDTSLGTLEAEARAARRGLWADKNPMPPWEFRKTKRDAHAN